MAIATINPATGEQLKVFDTLSDIEIEERLQLADDTFRRYRRASFDERARGAFQILLIGSDKDEITDCGKSGRLR
ncbi:MAG: hypothetical protein L0229_06400 [Blastocatellia bacterium]|nr:hypothetical protein [Blastocatellia bacterium]